MNEYSIIPPMAIGAASVWGKHEVHQHAGLAGWFSSEPQSYLKPFSTVKAFQTVTGTKSQAYMEHPVEFRSQIILERHIEPAVLCQP